MFSRRLRIASSSATFLTSKRTVNTLCPSGISLPLEADESDALRIAGSTMKRAGILPARLRFRIYRKSVDARKKTQIKLVYSVAAYSDEPICADPERLAKLKISVLDEGEINIAYGGEPALLPPLVVGMGPAGLFCAPIAPKNTFFAKKLQKNMILVLHSPEKRV